MSFLMAPPSAAELSPEASEELASPSTANHEAAFLRLPVELIEQIVDGLSRQDVENLRCVCKGLESKVTGAFFKSAVVPFNSELLAMVNREPRVIYAQLSIDDAATAMSLPWLSDKSSRGTTWRGYGYSVFKGFGPHLRHFGMSFEITEEDIARAPPKFHMKKVDSYHGEYTWVPDSYPRFKDLAALEDTADNSYLLREAMSHVVNTKSLGLSLNNGHGFQAGLGAVDKWCPAYRPSIFGKQFDRTRPQQHFTEEPQPAALMISSGSLLMKLLDDVLFDWRPIGHISDMRQLELRSVPHAIALKYLKSRIYGSLPDAAICERPFDFFAGDRSMLHEAVSTFVHTQYTSDADFALSTENLMSRFETVLSRARGQGEPATSQDLAILSQLLRDCHAVVMSRLSGVQSAGKLSYTAETQEEWLLEADWAQKAFAQTYLLSIMDNKSTLANVTSFNIASIPSAYLAIMCRDDLWMALPALSHLRLLVLPEVSGVRRDDGNTLAYQMAPSAAAHKLYVLLDAYIGKVSTITHLEIGYVRAVEDAIAGGSHIHYLPAPVVHTSKSLIASPATDQDDYDGLVNLPHVRSLKLVNCYVHPQILKAITWKLQDCSLSRLELSRVSIVALSHGGLKTLTTLGDTRRREYRVGADTWPVLINDIAPQPVMHEVNAGQRLSHSSGCLKTLVFQDCGYAMCNAAQMHQGLSLLPVAIEANTTNRKAKLVRAFNILAVAGIRIPDRTSLYDHPALAPPDYVPAVENDDLRMMLDELARTHPHTWTNIAALLPQAQLRTLPQPQPITLPPAVPWHTIPLLVGPQMRGMIPPPQAPRNPWTTAGGMPAGGNVVSARAGLTWHTIAQAAAASRPPQLGGHIPGFVPPPARLPALPQGRQLQELMSQAAAYVQECNLAAAEGLKPSAASTSICDAYLATLVTNHVSHESRILHEHFHLHVKRIEDVNDNANFAVPIWTLGDTLTFSGVIDHHEES